MAIPKIVIDSTTRVLYASFYIQGLYEIFGRRNVTFGRRYFKDLVREEKLFSFNHFFAFVLIDNGKTTRFVVDFSDPTDISREAYDWCDVYAKINFNVNYPATDTKKIVVIAPGFGIRVWSLTETLFQAARNLLSGFFSLPVKPKTFLQDYWQQYKKVRIERYYRSSYPKNSNGTPFVFMTATLWRPHEDAEMTNIFRKRFMEICQAMRNVEFEGGLYATPEHPIFREFESAVISRPYDIEEFIEKHQRSAISFNTPAVHHCHGWKLGEFLAMGKPILSTPLSNELPAPLVHGEHIHIIQTEDEMHEAILKMINDSDYRNKLAENTLAYYQKHASPAQVIRSIIQKAEAKNTGN